MCDMIHGLGLTSNIDCSSHAMVSFDRLAHGVSTWQPLGHARERLSDVHHGRLQVVIRPVGMQPTSCQPQELTEGSWECVAV